jgi:hypothetical protein
VADFMMRTVADQLIRLENTKDMVEYHNYDQNTANANPIDNIRVINLLYSQIEYVPLQCNVCGGIS